MNGVWVAFGLTVFAGMATGIGSIIAFTAKRTNYRQAGPTAKAMTAFTGWCRVWW
jgi:hypothetical protein